MWACTGFFSVPGILCVNELVYVLQQTAQHCQETFFKKKMIVKTAIKMWKFDSNWKM
jgi:hypothetical protein